MYDLFCEHESGVLPAYVELHCVSNFSFLRGASFPEELLQRAVDLGYEGLAITNECSFSGIVRAYSAWRALGESGIGFRLLTGSQFYTADGLHLVLLARNRCGYRQISQLISDARRDAAKGEYRLDRPMLEAFDGSDCLMLWVPSPQFFQDSPGRDQARENLAWQTGLPVCASGGVMMHTPSRRPLRDTLNAIRLGKAWHELGFQLPANGQQYLRPRTVLAKLYPASWLAETVNIAGLCEFSLAELRYEYPRELVPDNHTAQSWLRLLTMDGMRQHWP